jgi:hypothetical protein
MSDDTTNPKDRLGVAKPDLSLVPPSAIIEEARALEDGAVKYGPYNWREKKVRARVYIAAAKRHMDSWLDGENFSRDTRYVRLTADEEFLGSYGLLQGDVTRVVDEGSADIGSSLTGYVTVVYVASGVEGSNELIMLSPEQYETVREPVHHLAHARACLGIIIDAESIGALVDDRPTRGAAGDLIKRYTKKG